jgi:hypothetical protein
MEAHWKVRNREDGSADDSGASFSDRTCSDEPDRIEACTSLAGRPCRNSAQAGEFWKFFKESDDCQTGLRVRLVMVH